MKLLKSVVGGRGAGGAPGGGVEGGTEGRNGPVDADNGEEKDKALDYV